jgi:hypothetical protein
MADFGKRRLALLLVPVVGWAIYSARDQVVGVPVEKLKQTPAAQAEPADVAPELDFPVVVSRAQAEGKAPVAGNAKTAMVSASSAGVAGAMAYAPTMHSMLAMKQLLKCYQSQDCQLDRSTPSSYNDAINDGLVNALNDYRGIVSEAGYQQPELLNQASIVARTFLRFPEDGVREAAIDILSELPPTSENAEAIIRGLTESVSPSLHRTGIKELQRYAGSAMQSQIETFLFDTLKTGAVSTAREAARQSGHFMTEQNLSAFQATLKTVPARSLIYQELSMNIAEFQRQQRGG